MKKNESNPDLRPGSKKQMDDQNHPSNQIWSVYMSEAILRDKGLVESWKSDMDGTLIFAGLFSAIVTAFLIESFKDLKTDSNNSDINVQLLEKISYQLAALSSGHQTVGMSRPQFQRNTQAIRINAFWFLSLVFGLSCALLATLVQQWARSYFQAIERRPTPNKKARIRSYLYYGIETYQMATVVEAIPALLHIAVFLFFAGLFNYLIILAQDIAYVVLGVISIFVGLYIIATLLPILHRDCPYWTPLTPICWRIAQFLGLLHYTNSTGKSVPILGNMTESREMLATADVPDRNQRDAEALRWTLHSLTDDSQLVPFLESIPAFLESFTDELSNAMTSLAIEIARPTLRLLQTCTIPSALVDALRSRRAVACINAFSSLVRISGVEQWTQDWLDVVIALTTLQIDQVHSIATTANAALDIIKETLPTRIAAWAERADLPEGESFWSYISFHTKYMAQQRALAEQEAIHLSFALQALDTLGSIDAVIEQIPRLVRSTTYRHSPAMRRYRLGELLFRCHNHYIPRRLATCEYSWTKAQEMRKNRCVEACTAALRELASDFHLNPANAMPLLALKEDQKISIADLAISTTTYLAYQAQLGIVYSVQHPCNKTLFVKCYSMLNALGILESLEEYPNIKVDLQQQFLFGLEKNPGSEGLWMHLMGMQTHNCDSCIMEHQHLSGLGSLELYTSRRQVRVGDQHIIHRQILCTLPPFWKYALIKAHTITLIACLKAITKPHFLDGLKSLQITLETLRFMTPSMLVRYSSQNIQTLLVKLVDSIIKKLNHSGSSSEDISEVTNILFSILGTIGNPQSIKSAKVVINDYLAQHPWCDAALNAHQQLHKYPSDDDCSAKPIE